MKNFQFEKGEQLVLEVVNKPDSPGGSTAATTEAVQHVARVPLEYSDFLTVRDEAWWWGVRLGLLSPDLDSHEMRVIPGEDAGDGIRNGYEIELLDRGRSYRRVFTNQSMASVANRKILEITRDKTSELSLNDQYSYYLTTVPADNDVRPNSIPVSGKSCRQPLMFETASLAEYMAASKTLQGVSEPLKPPQEPPMQIFVTDEVWQESREQAHRGGDRESAALFSGRLFRDTGSDEVFMEIDACLEAAHAVEEELAVTFTGETWTHALGLLGVRRQRLNRPNEIIVGSVHRHPFMPSADANGNRKCQACEVAKYCSRSTATPSAHDFEWHRSVFAGQPYGVLLIWGYTAREEADFRLYGLENGCLREREIRLLK